jgi:hypothetical protein
MQVNRVVIIPSCILTDSAERNLSKSQTPESNAKKRKEQKTENQKLQDSLTEIKRGLENKLQDFETQLQKAKDTLSKDEDLSQQKARLAQLNGQLQDLNQSRKLQEARRDARGMVRRLHLQYQQANGADKQQLRDELVRLGDFRLSGLQFFQREFIGR